MSTQEYRFGTHARDLEQAEARKVWIFPSVRTPPAALSGPVPRFVYARGQDQDQIAALVWAPAPVAPAVGQAPPADYIFGTHAQALYNAEALKSFIVRAQPGVPTVPPAAPLRSLWASPEYTDLSISAWVAASVFGNTGPILPTIIARQPDVDLSLPAQLRAPLAFTPPVPNPVITSYFVGAQRVDLTQQPWITPTAIKQPVQGPVPPMVWATQADPTQRQPIIIPSTQFGFAPPPATTVRSWRKGVSKTHIKK